jgi:hypothetical protein
MLIPNKYNGYSADGRRIYNFGGGSSAPTYTESKVTNSNIPEYAQPYVENMLGAAQKQVYSADGTSFQPYKAYGGTYDAQGNRTSYDPSKGIAGFQPMQQTAQQGIQGMQMPGQYDTAANTTQTAMDRAMGMQYNPAAINVQQAAAPGLQNYQMGPALGVSAQQVGTPTMDAAQTGYNPQLQNYQMGPAQQISTQSFTQPGSADQYMSPYMQNVVETQKREATRQSGIQGTQQQAQAAQAGAFGGGRDAIMRAERERNLSQQMGDIQATGSQAAYQQAQQQFNAEQQARLGAQQANQQAGLTVGGQNLAANLGVQQLGTQTGAQTSLANLSSQQQANVQNQAAQLQAQGMNSQQAMQAALANQQAGLTVGGQNLSAALGTQQLGSGQNMQAQLANQQAMAQAQQLQAQQQQFGANYGLQGIQAGMQGANQLAGLGGQKLQAQQGIYGLQNQYGAQQQALEQSKLNQAQQDYANQQQYPMMQLGSLSNMLRGLPMQSSSTNMYQAQPNALTQGIGTAGTMASLYNAYNNPNAPKPMAAGGITSIPRYDVGGQVMSQLQQMDDEALAREAKESPSQEIRRMATEILKTRQAGMDSAPQMAAAPQMDMAPQPQQDMGMAGGGIIAFADRGKVDEAEAARYKNQSDMYILGAQQAAAERQAQEAAIPTVNDRTPRDPSAYRADVPYAENENLPLGQRITNTLDRIRSRTDPAFVPRSAAAPNDTTAVLNENEFPPAGITAAAPKATRLSPRAAEFAAMNNYKAPTNRPAAVPTKTGGKLLSEDEFFANKPASSAETSYTGTKLSPESLETLEAQAAGGKRGYADMLQAYYKKFPKAVAPAVDPNSILAATSTTDTAVPNADTAAITAAQVDPLADAQKAVNTAQTLADKSVLDRINENAEARKTLGLDQNEAAQEARKSAMAQKANINDEAERTKYLRLAEFFATWGSTPGDTLVAGMKAVKEKIPNMITDVKEQRKALAEADKVLYELGQADRKEKLGQFDEATKQKEEAAKIAMQLNMNLSTVRGGIESQKISKEGSIKVAGINKAGSFEVAGVQERASNYSANTQLRIAELREESASVDRSANRTNADENKKFGQYQAASQQEILVNNRIANEENGKQHVSDVKFISDASNIDPSDLPAGYPALIAATKKRIQTREKNWNDQLKDAKRNTELAYSRVSGVSPTMSTSSATATMTRADVEATAKASGKSVAEVEAAAAAKGIKIK